MDSTKRLAFRLENLQVLALGYPFEVNLEKSLSVDPGLEYLETIDSTNLELSRRLQAESHPDLFALVAAEQTAGRGRLDRSWVSEPGTSISLSILLKPTSQIEIGLIPLFVGSQVARALSDSIGTQARVKWPNDVLVAGKKISGVLSELSQREVVVGIGINLKKQRAAPDTSCAVSDFADRGFDEVLAAVLRSLRTGWQRWLDGGNEFALSQIRTASLTLGQQVRAILPNGEVLEGEAVAIEDDGRLRISGDQSHLVSAADVWHLRN